MAQPLITIEDLSAAYADAAGTVDQAGIAALVHHLTYHLLDLRHCCSAEVFRPRMVEALIQLNAQASALGHEPLPIGNHSTADPVAMEVT